MNFQECDLGFTFKNSEVLVFFGKVYGDLEKIKNHFSTFEFYGVRQTHSDLIVQASSNFCQADAHWTSQPLKALFVLTADCIPVFICNRKTHVIAAIHAGWRGIENHIVLKSLKQLMTATSQPEDFEIWVGPHILKNSFEVRQEVFDLLMTSSFQENKNTHYLKKDDRFFVDLKEILDSQITALLSKIPLSHFLNLDTQSNPLFHSYRRDKEKAGRNISFIVQMPKGKM